MSTFGDKLRALRETRGLSQAAVAREIEGRFPGTAMSQVNISVLEKRDL